MSVGHPGESEQTINDVADFLIKNGTDDFDCTVITPYPGTPYYDKSVEIEDNVYKYTVEKTGDCLYSKTLDYATTSNFYKGVPGQNYESYVYTDYLNSTEIVKLRDELESCIGSTSVVGVLSPTPPDNLSKLLIIFHSLLKF